MRNGTMSLEKFVSVKKDLDTTYFPTSFNCLKDHNGWRNGELHTLISPTGSGKSTFVRSAVIENLIAGKKVFIYLSEEESDKYNYGIFEFFLLKIAKERNLAPGDPELLECVNGIMKNLFYESAFEGKKFDAVPPLIDYIKKCIADEDINIIYIDNFTASFMGNGPVGAQGIAVMLLKGLAIDFNCPVVLIVHTQKDFDQYRQIMSSSNVRGNASTANVGSYNYCITTFWRGEKARSFILVDKARYHGKVQKRYYELVYNQSARIFSGDKESSIKEYLMAQSEGQEKEILPKQKRVNL